MKTVLFCGGEGTRIREANPDLPKPLITVGGLPILLYVMIQYAKNGHTDFILCAGYKIQMIEEFVVALQRGLLDFNYEKWNASGFIPVQDWTINVVDTGNSCIGERLWKVRHLLLSEKSFFANYSDVLSSIDVNLSYSDLVEKNSVCSFASVKPSQAYHWVYFDKDEKRVLGLRESYELGLYINGGFMCLKPEIFDYMKAGEELVIEPFNRLVKAGKLSSFKFDSYWRSIDTYKDLLSAEAEVESDELIYVHS